ncbi:terminase small subunit [Aestuariibaculum marinum]|uniref:Terminase small subunit n=1 Tax=Aestuariibaculum marinum TaxID=2683592 RepID=A0A8J6Q021_9FLAO|nr:terminase small subunit [Aestuariibaculum marinum]MBD0822624.1 terminase small subunit [Aestuariibaculum marinum]
MQSTESTSSPLSPKREMFCQEYVVDYNATQAAIRSGYSERTARSQGQRLLTKADISARIEELKEEIKERNKITIDECVQMLTAMARFDVADLYNEDGSLKAMKDIPKEARLVIEGFESDEIKIEDAVIGVSRKVKLSSRRSNIIELMKHLGGYEKDNNQKKTDNVVMFKLPDNGRNE